MKKMLTHLFLIFVIFCFNNLLLAEENNASEKADPYWYKSLEPNFELQEILPKVLKRIQTPQKVLENTKIKDGILSNDTTFLIPVMVYVPKNQTIFVHVAAFRDTDKNDIIGPIEQNELAYSLAHELGHAVYFQLLTPAEIEAWRVITPDFHDKTRYGKNIIPWKSRAELFADVYLKKYLLKQSKEEKILIKRTLDFYKVPAEQEQKINHYFQKFVEPKFKSETEAKPTNNAR